LLFIVYFFFEQWALASGFVQQNYLRRDNYDHSEFKYITPVLRKRNGTGDILPVLFKSLACVCCHGQNPSLMNCLRRIKRWLYKIKRLVLRSEDVEEEGEDGDAKDDDDTQSQYPAGATTSNGVVAPVQDPEMTATTSNVNGIVVPVQAQPDAGIVAPVQAQPEASVTATQSKKRARNENIKCAFLYFILLNQFEVKGGSGMGGRTLDTFYRAYKYIFISNNLYFVTIFD
jgi:hypothetical protein